MLRTFCAAAALTLGLLTLSTAATAAPVYPPGYRIGLEPAPGLVLSHQFPGFEDARRGVVVSMMALPAAAYGELMRQATAKNQRGLTDVTRASFMFASGVGLLVSGKAKDNGVPVHRWFLIASAAEEQVPNLAAMIRVEVPDVARSVYADSVVRKMLSTVSFRNVPMKELLGLLPFRLTALAGFKVVKALPNGLIVADSAAKGPGKQPYAIITADHGGPEQRSDRGRFARDLLNRSPLRDLTLTLAQPIRINGAPGFEIRADAIGMQGHAIALVQWLRFIGVGNSFLRIVAVAPKPDFDAAFERFRTLRDGMVLR